MNPFHVRELNGEMRQDWGPTAGLVRNLQPMGGPFEHRWVDGVCRVCNLAQRQMQPGWGCPAGVNMATLKTSKPLSTPGEVEAAAIALRAIWAAEMARTEDVV